MLYGFIKVAAGSPRVAVADADANASAIQSMLARADAAGANLLVLPGLCVTGCTCGDLFRSEALLDAAQNALIALTQGTRGLYPVVVLGLPLRVNGSLYNCAAVLHDGRLLGIVPQAVSAAGRQFVSCCGHAPSETLSLGGSAVPFGANLLFRCSALPEFCIGAELCEDAQSIDPPARRLCQQGATVIANPSASSEVVGAREYRRKLAQSASSRLICGYVVANPASGESTQDTVYSAHNLICENGSVLTENPPFGENDLIFSEIDVKSLLAERRRATGFMEAERTATIVSFNQPLRSTVLTRAYVKNPFVPETPIAERAEEILRIQSQGLKKRIEHTRARAIVVGISGGLDSCLSLLVMARTMDLMGRPRKDIVAISMPCFGTTSRTRSNAEKLCEQLGVTFREIVIADSVRQHFQDIGHDESIRDVTYENGQARERTQVLMDVANKIGGMVIGTGDLSELALGWATYNGDHMSMYGVNAGIPKTLIRHIVRCEADRSNPELAGILRDILDTPVSPELLPADSQGEIQQKTEDLVGPYELHDFYLYYAVRYGFAPKKIYHLAKHAFGDEYSTETILKWLRTFFRRFFMQQFKRSCLPDGPKVGSVSLSPRGDWLMPSDACSALWLKEIDELQP